MHALNIYHVFSHLLLRGEVTPQINMKTFKLPERKEIYCIYTLHMFYTYFVCMLILVK